MWLLQRIWRDLRKGENILLIVTVLVAISLPILNLFGLASQAPISSITLAVLGLLAIATLVDRYKLEQILEGIEKFRLGRTPPVRVYEHWTTPEVGGAIRSAKESITVIGSWVGDVGALSNHIRNASENTSRPLKVNVYMLDPDRPFGEQRYTEVFGTSGNGFRRLFTSEVQTIKSYLAAVPNIKLTIFKYATMPELRMYVMDDKDFIFGWFQLGAASSQNPCFHLSTSFATKETRLAIGKLRDHLKCIQKMSQVVS